jgi:hypothetical protein
MKTIRLAQLSLVLACSLSVSCVIGKREVSIKVPVGTHPAAKGQVSLGSIQDARTFQNKPAEPSTPSVEGDFATLTAQQRENNIGRQRNSYGKGMGEVVLPAGGTVTAKMSEIITEALARRGYTVAGSGTPVNVKISQFWGWMTPGMWAITLEARITAGVTVRGQSTQITGYGENVCQAATTANWNLAYERAIADFLDKAGAALGSAGL